MQISSVEESGSVFEQVAQNNHEQVVYCYDEASGLKALVAIHNTVLGPAAGGVRMWMYENESQALHDVLRLSRGMTFKNAISGLNLGGGKAVIIGDARQDKSEKLFRSFGKFIEGLAGRYITAEDVGISPQDIEYMTAETSFVAGKPESMGGGGDPSPVTAYGVYMGIKAAAKEVYGSDSLENKKVSLQGVGHVGIRLLEYLSNETKNIYISDYYEDRCKEASKQFGVEVVEKDAIYDLDVDIYAPCALGATINRDTLSRLKCDIIAGAANNQLADEAMDADLCQEQGILYAPDFLINAGGIINVYYEITGNYSQEKAYQHAERIYGFTQDIFRRAKKQNINTHKAALHLALERIESIGRLKMRS